MMTNFNLKDFNKDGQEYCVINFEFNTTTCLTIDSRTESVSVRPSVVAAAGCDFIGGGSSCSSENFYEVSGLPVINGLFFKSDYKFKLRGFVYALPENTVQVATELKQHIKTFIAEQSKAMRVDADVLDSLM